MVDGRVRPRGVDCVLNSAASSKIVAALLVAFNRHVWQMWQARTRRSETMPAVGGAAAPMDPIFNNMPPQAVGADGQLGAE